MRWIFVALFIVSVQALSSAQELTVQGNIEVVHKSKGRAGSANVVVWLIPASASAAATTSPPARLVQRDKKFSPHVVAVRVGSEIEFPNQDLFFHDVFSIYHGTPFDLGLYEGGSTRKIRFFKPGVSYIFCNIHPEMSAVVVSVPTSYFAVTSEDGSFRIQHLPPGRYKMQLWYELASPDELESLSRNIDLDTSTLQIRATVHSSDLSVPHMNKYGQEYSFEKPKSY